jgi:hypothetical protein
MGFVMDKFALGQVFSEYYGVVLSILNSQTAPHSSTIIRER